jgi:hypothetical protein
MLQQQETMLTSAAQQVSGVRTTTNSLADAQRQEADLKKALDAVPQGETGNVHNATLRTQLAGQLDVAAKQCDALERELAILQGGVRVAMTIPLPNTTDSTAGVVAAVMALVQERTPQEAPPANVDLASGRVAIGAGASTGSHRVAASVRVRAPSVGSAAVTRASAEKLGMDLVRQVLGGMGR